MLLDRPEEALSVGTVAQRTSALLAADRATEVLEQRPVEPSAATLAHAALLIQAQLRGDQLAARRELEWLAAECPRVAWGRAWWVHWLLVPWNQARNGDPSALARAVEQRGPATGEGRWHDAQRPWNAVRFLAGITDERPVVNQTSRHEARGTALFVQALRLDLANDPGAAAAWLALPPQQRVLPCCTAILWLNAWRGGALQRSNRCRRKIAPFYRWWDSLVRTAFTASGSCGRSACLLGVSFLPTRGESVSLSQFKFFFTVLSFEKVDNRLPAIDVSCIDGGLRHRPGAGHRPQQPARNNIHNSVDNLTSAILACREIKITHSRNNI